MKIEHKSQIKVNVGLDENRVPVKMEWEASDNPNGEETKECKALLMSVFDKESKDTMKIDLWTTEMQIAEMDRFFFQTLRAMSDTYFKATQNKELANDMHRFVQYFGEQVEIIPKSKEG